MKIGVDFLADRLGQSGSIGFHRNFVYWVSRLAEEEKYFIFVYHSEYGDYQRYLADGQTAVKLMSLGEGNAPLWKRLFDQQLRVPYFYKKKGIDRGFSDNIIPFLGPGSIQWVYRVIIMQQFHREYSENRKRAAYRRWTTRWACRKARFVVPNSSHTRGEIQRFLAVPPEKIVAVGEAVDHEVYHPIQDKAAVYRFLHEKFGLVPPYILQVSGYYDHKNPLLSIRVLQWLQRRNIKMNFVLVGADPLGNLPRYEGIADELGVRAAIKFIPFQVPEVLRLIYNGALALVFPSTSETFGIPPLEAMACGIPVVASNASAVPEVVKDAGLIVDPYDIESFGGAVESIIKTEAVRRRLVERGLQHVKDFRWQDVISRLRSIILSG